MKRTILAASIAAFVICGCKSDEKTDEPTTQSAAAMGALNDTCPISGNPVAENASTVSYGGYEVGFCCNGCVGKWNDESADYKRKYVATQTKK